MEDLSEEQRIALEEKRQRSEKISRLMGPYLLKRYRMLNETCDVCESILLQSPQGLKYCVNCEEIENDKTYLSNNPVQLAKPIGPSPQTESVLLAKLQTAVTSLHESSSVENSIQQCQLIKAAADALLAVRRLNDTSNTENS